MNIRASAVLFALSILCLVPGCGDFSSPARAQTRDLQAILDKLGDAGGGTHRLSSRRIVNDGGIVVPRGVTLDLNGAELVVSLAGDQIAGVRMMSHSTLRGGTVTVRSHGNPGAQAGIHAPVLVGALYGENRSPARLSRFAAPHDWRIEDMVLRSDKQVGVGDGATSGAAGIQIVGGASRGIIQDIRITDSPVMVAGIAMDWGTVGPMDAGDVRASATAYRSARGFTTHPHDIVVRNVAIGRLSRHADTGTGSFGIRLSGVHDISIDGVAVALTTRASFAHTAGDLGYEFARREDSTRAHRGIVLKNMSVEAVGDTMILTDSYADNVGRAARQGYRPRLSPVALTDIAIGTVTGTAARTGRGVGIRIDHQHGGTYTDIEARGFARGFVVDAQVSDVMLVRPVSVGSTDFAIFVGHDGHPPERITLVSPEVRDHRSRGRAIEIVRSSEVIVRGADQHQVRISGAAHAAVSE